MDFIIKNEAGQSLWYEVNYDEETVTVYKDEEPEGSLVIPESVTHEGKTYSVTSIGKYAFNGCTRLTSVIIPNSVTKIGDCAFYECEGLIGTLTIPNSVTTIGEEAFSGCAGLTEVFIPASVEEIGYDVFRCCSAHENINVDDDNSTYKSVDGVLYEIDEDNLIPHCCPEGKTSVYLPASVEELFYEEEIYGDVDTVFQYCEKLTEINVDEANPNYKSVDGIVYSCRGGEVTLAFCPRGKSSDLTIPDSVIKITDHKIFAYCCELTTVICKAITPPEILIPKAIKEKDLDFFYDNEKLTIYVPAESVKAYKKAIGWKEYNIQPIQEGKMEETSKNTKIKSEAEMEFLVKNEAGQTLKYEVNYDEETVTVYKDEDNEPEGSLVISESVTHEGNTYRVTSIGDEAFYGCAELTEVFIPASVEEIEYSAFGECFALENINVDDDNSTYKSVDGVLYQMDDDTLTPLYCPEGKTSVYLPASVETFFEEEEDCYAETVFQNCEKLTEINVDEDNSNYKSVDGIVYSCRGGEVTLAFCPRGKSGDLSIPDYGDGIIGNGAFCGCNELTSVIIPNSITEIYSSFRNCEQLVEVTIGESVTKIMDWAFNGCKELTTVICKAITPPEILIPKAIKEKDLDFFYDNEKLTIYVPAESVKAYKKAIGWKEYNIQPIQEGKMEETSKNTNKNTKTKSEEKMNTLYRCYNTEKAKDSNNEVVGSSLFDLIGKKEPDLTKAFGYVLARSEVAMRAFLSKVFEKESNRKKRVNELMQQDCIVDCELRLMNEEDNADRADIVIRFPQRKEAIIVEAKSLNAGTHANKAIEQAQSYAERMGETCKIVSLTNYCDYNVPSGVVPMQWSDIIDMFDEIVRKDTNLWLEKDFLKYILKIKGIMKYYDVEVLSIPAGVSLKGVEETKIYECPTDGSYRKRGEHKPLFMAFRAAGGGEVRKLYKVEQVVAMPVGGKNYETAKSNLPEHLAKRLEDYRNLGLYDVNNEDEKWVFFLDEERSIELPNPVRYKNNNSYVETKRSLREYFQKPNEDGFVVFDKYEEEE